MPRPYHTPAFIDRPFEGQGLSLYVTQGTEVRYRHLRALPPLTGRRAVPPVKGSSDSPDWSATNVTKTARVASVAGTAGQEKQLDFSLPAALLDETFSVDVRHFKDDVENLTTGFLTQTLTADGGGDPVFFIDGAATMLTPEIRAGGIVRLRWRYFPGNDGVAPARFRVQFTAGPTSPDDLTTDFVGAGLYALDTAALSDAGAYTITLSIEDEAPAVTRDLVTGYQFTADASGPPAPTLVSGLAT